MAKHKHIVTKESLIALVTHENKALATQAIGKALVVIFNNQTATEQNCNDTHEDNGVGFTGFDAKSGCISAKSFIKTKTLQPWVIDMWTRKTPKGNMRIAKYWKQIDKAAQLKAQQNG